MMKYESLKKFFILNSIWNYLLVYICRDKIDRNVCFIIFELFSFAWGNINGFLFFFDNFTKGKKIR